jgi:hypothetical protein
MFFVVVPGSLYEVPFTPNEGHGFRTLSAIGFEEFPLILVHFYARPASNKGSLARKNSFQISFLNPTMAPSYYCHGISVHSYVNPTYLYGSLAMLALGFHDLKPLIVSKFEGR